MICLRCGYCCIHLWVIIVDDPKIGIVDGNLISKNSGEPCKHLQGKEAEKYSCALHDESWYKQTPCFKHTQIEQQSNPCRMGVYILEQKDKLGVR